MVLAAGILALLWDTSVDADEQLPVGLAQSVLVGGEYAPRSFVYPHLPVYAHALGTVAYGILASSGGLWYHDPYSNQLYIDGSRRTQPRKLPFDPNGYHTWVFDLALPWIRRGYALLAALTIIAGYALARTAASPRAGLYAALALAAQPLLMRASILPNAPGATLALLTCLFMLRGSNGAFPSFAKGCAAGLMTGWKFNPAFGVVALGLAALEAPRGSRWRRLATTLAGLPLGFLAVYPSLPWRLPLFMADLAGEAHHYAWEGHRGFTTDTPLGTALFVAYFRLEYPGNYLVLTLAAIGAGALLLRLNSVAGRRAAWVIIAPAVLSAALLLQQMVQFGRNYTIPIALVCVLSGLGADSALARLASRRRALTAAAVALAVGISSVGTTWWWQVKSSLAEPTARRRAIEWVESTAPLGASVKLVEGGFARLEGRLPDRARFRVRQGKLGARHFDYFIVAGDRPFQFPGDLIEKHAFEGRPIWDGPSAYTVYQFRPQSGS